MSKSNMKKLTFIMFSIVLFFISTGVYAKDLNISIEDVKVVEKNSGVTVSDTNFSNDTLTSNINFSNQNDYVVFEVKLKNNSDKKYKALGITDNNTLDNIEITYDFDENVNPNESYKFKVKVLYKEKLVNQDSITLNDLIISLNLMDESGNTSSVVINNPLTGDGILHYLVLLIISITGLYFIKKKIRFKINNKKIKVGTYILLFAVVILPFCVFAVEKYTLNLKIKGIVLESEYLDYTVSFNTNGGNSIESRTVTYGQQIGELPTGEKEGYNFNGWKDQTGNTVTNTTKVTKELQLTADFSIVEYSITYDLNHGKVTPTNANPTKYTIEDEIELVNPTRKGYTFAGWSIGNSEEKYTTIRILHETGAKTYKANWSRNEDTTYTVINKYEKLDGTYEIVEDEQHGPTDTEVTAPFSPKTGFDNPEPQQVTISGEGDSTVTYIYKRHEYRLTVNEDVETTFTNPTYPYETEITITAKDKDNYEFTGWSNGETTKTISFDLEEDTNIYPIYEATAFTITFNSNGGGNVNSITVNVGKTIQSFETPTAPTNKKFDGWYTDLSNGTKVSTPYTPVSDITLYAHWKEETFPTVFSQEGECTFNGSNGVITGDDCEYANGVNKYIDTGINLYNEENHDKDYEIGFTIVSYNPSEQVKQATFVNTKLEGNNYPGLVFRRKDNETVFDLSSRKTSSANERKLFNYGDVEKVKIYRITNQDTGVQEIFYSINDADKVKLNDLSSFNPTFDLSVWFGATPTNASATTAQRILVNTTLKDMYIKLGTYQESSNTETYKVTYNANGGSVSPSSKTINIGEQIGTLPTPTAPSGKSFAGWYTELTGGVKVTSSYIPNNNITIYARYINDISGATISPSSISILNGGNETITVSNVGEEYTFTSNDTSVATVDSTGKVTGTGVGTTTITITGSTSGKTKTVNVTVESSTYTVTLNPNGGTLTTTSITKDKGVAVGTLPTPTAPTGKDFDGWYTGLTDGIEVTSTYTPNSDVTIYARYTDQTFTVSFDTDGESEVSSQTITYGEKATRPTTDPTKTGYTFDNWYTDTNYDTVFDFENTAITSDTTIYAHFVDSCRTFSTDSWSTIKDNLESDSSYYAVGCEKEVELDMDDDGTNESYTVRLANTSTPEVCNTEGYSQTACGTVIEFADIVDERPMNSTKTNAGGWKETAMVTYLNSEFYNKLPSSLQSVIIPTYPIVSGSGSGGISDNITDNDTTKNKMYLLSTREIGLDSEYDNKRNELIDTRTLDYYSTNNNNNARIKKDLTDTDKTWWLRSAFWKYDSSFCYETNFGTHGYGYANYHSVGLGVAPAFRIGTMPEFTVSFDTDEGSLVSSQTITYGEKATRPSTNPTKTGYTFDDWYTDDTYTTKFDFDTPITEDTTIYAHFEELKVCADNENITRLSENTCSNNENITIGDGIVCKRAVKLHEETCSYTDGTYSCLGAGYTESGSKGTSTITYGSCGTSGTLSSGDAFTCDVNGDEKFDELTERFYYVSDYYDTSAKKFDTSTAVLIYYNNVTSGVSCNKNRYAYDLSGENWHGPRTLVSQLPTTSQWSNVSLKSVTRDILGEYQSTHDSPTTTGGTLPTDFSYEGYAARLLTAKELMAGCNLTEVGRLTRGELDSCNYIMENTQYAKSFIGSWGHWLETPYSSRSTSIWVVYSYIRYVGSVSANYTSDYGVRPVIEVPKSKIEYGASSTYTVTLNANGGSVNPTSITVNNGDAIGTLPTPTAPTGKSFTGWYTELTGGIEVTSSYVPNTDIEIYARYNSTYTVSFDTDGGSTVASQTVNHGGVATRPSTNPKKEGMAFVDWYTDNTYTTIFDFENTEITNDTTVYAKWRNKLVSANNIGTTELSQNNCSNNVNININDDIVCKRAIKLHNETCPSGSRSGYCNGKYGNSKDTKITYGNCGTRGTLKDGDAFTCDVNGDGIFDEESERFYYLGKYYDPDTNSYNSDVGVLIYYNNVVDGLADNSTANSYNSNGRNYYGPVDIATNLPTISQWSNVSLVKSNRQILNEKIFMIYGEQKKLASNSNLPIFNYNEYAARFVTIDEMVTACGIMDSSIGELDDCNYVFENTEYANPNLLFAIWTETPYSNNSTDVWTIFPYDRDIYKTPAQNATQIGARPVIEVPISKINY